MIVTNGGVAPASRKELEAEAPPDGKVAKKVENKKVIIWYYKVCIMNHWLIFNIWQCSSSKSLKKVYTTTCLVGNSNN